MDPLRIHPSTPTDAGAGGGKREVRAARRGSAAVPPGGRGGGCGRRMRGGACVNAPHPRPHRAAAGRGGWRRPTPTPARSARRRGRLRAGPRCSLPPGRAGEALPSALRPPREERGGGRPRTPICHPRVNPARFASGLYCPPLPAPRGAVMAPRGHCRPLPALPPLSPLPPPPIRPRRPRGSPAGRRGGEGWKGGRAPRCPPGGRGRRAAPPPSPPLIPPQPRHCRGRPGRGRAALPPADGAARRGDGAGVLEGVCMWSVLCC